MPNKEGYGSGQFGPNYDGLSWREHRHKLRSTAVKVPACAFDSLAILIIRQAVHNQRAELAKNIRRYISRPLCCENTS